MSDIPIHIKNKHIESDENSDKPDIESNEKKFTFTRNPKDIIYMLLFISFGLWILSELLLRPTIFGDLASMCGPFLVLGGFCFIFNSPIKIRKAGALLGLLGSGVASLMFFTLQEMINDMGTWVYSPINALIGLIVSIVCLFISIAQLCKTL